MEGGREVVKQAVISRLLRAYKSGRNKQCVRCGPRQVRADGKLNRPRKCKDRGGWRCRQCIGSHEARNPNQGVVRLQVRVDGIGSGQEGDRGREKKGKKSARASEDEHATRTSSVTERLKPCCGLASVSCRIFRQPRPGSPTFIKISGSDEAIHSRANHRPTIEWDCTESGWRGRIVCKPRMPGETKKRWGAADLRDTLG